MERMKNSREDFKHDMLLQARLAHIIFDMNNAEKKDGGSHSGALEEWTGGEDGHQLAHFYREVLKERKKKPNQISLGDETALKDLAKKILERFHSDTMH